MNKKHLIIALLAFILLIALYVWSTQYMMKKMIMTEQVSIPQNAWLVLKLTGPIPEFNNMKLGFGNEDQPTVFELKNKIRLASDDPHIKGIILEPQFIQMGFGSLHELTSELQQFQNRGKKVYAYLQFVGTKDYILCAGADKIFMNPSQSAGFWFTGLGSQVTFFKGLMDRIGVTLHVVQAGKYKGYTDIYGRGEIGPDMKRNLDGMFSDLYKTIVSDLAKRRHIPESQFTWIFEQRDDVMTAPNAARTYGLVDSLLYEDDVYEQLRADRDHRVDIRNYNLSLAPHPGQKIAVVYLVGSIMPSNGQWGSLTINAKSTAKILDQLRKDTSVKGLVLRINSPGGSSLESDIILHEIQKFKHSRGAGFPVVVSMGDMDASGGYYITTAGDYVFADPFTITGSIGVVQMMPKFDRLGGKTGIRTQPIGIGKFNDLQNPWSPITEEEVTSLQRTTNRIYDEFKHYVSESRKLDATATENVAQGQIWSAQKATELHLADEIGSLDQAIKKAADLAKLPTPNVEYFPKQRSLVEFIMQEKLNTSSVRSWVLRALSEETGTQDAYFYLDMFRRDPLQMILPFTPTF